MPALIVIGVVLLLLFACQSKGSVDDANRRVKAERGTSYNARVAGRGWRDGTCLVLFALALTLGLLMLIGSTAVLLPK